MSGAASPDPTPTPMATWDSRLARLLVRPLANTPITANHLTTLSGVCGVAGAVLIGVGVPLWMNVGAALYMLAAFLDHTDGELARLTGTSSRFGFLYDQAVGSVLYALLFLGIGVGLRNGPLGNYAIALGVISTVAVGWILWVRFIAERDGGKAAVELPRFGGFEAEDFMYLIGPVTWLGGLMPFLVVSAIGAPIAAFILLRPTPSKNPTSGPQSHGQQSPDDTP